MTESTNRLEAFSDGVFAIAITLLILEIRLPHLEETAGSGGLLLALRGLWPSFLAYLLSFFVILIMWMNHHELIRLARGVDYRLFLSNGLVLLFVTFVPFPTAVLAEHLTSPAANAAAAFYCATFLVMSLAWSLLLRAIIVGRHRAGHDIPSDRLDQIRLAYRSGPLVYAVATAAAWWHPALGLLLNASLWVLWLRLCYREDARLR
jgi:uncharacterized membrane protein